MLTGLRPRGHYDTGMRVIQAMFEEQACIALEGLQSFWLGMETTKVGIGWWREEENIPSCTNHYHLANEFVPYSNRRFANNQTLAAQHGINHYRAYAGMSFCM